MPDDNEPSGPEKTPSRSWREVTPVSSLRIVAGFWEKAGAWALPLDDRGEGYARVLRERRVEIGYCTLFVFASGWGQTFLLSLFEPHWRAQLGISTAAMGTLYGVATLASGLLLPLGGRWLDQASSGKAAGVVLAGLVVASLLAAVSVNIWMLALALFTLRFFGQGMSANVGMTRAARWFQHNRGKAVSLAGLGFPIGEAILPVSVSLLIAGIGWRLTWVALAGICGLILAPVSFRLLAKRRALHGRSQAPPAPREPDPEEQRTLLTDWRFYAMLAVMAPVPFVGTGVIFFQGTIAEIRGWNAAVFPTGFMLFAIVRALFSLSAGAWVDRLGSLRLLALPTALFAAGLVALTQPSPVYAYVFFALLGVGFGASSGIMTTAWADLFGIQRIGLIKGISGSVAVIIAAVAPVAFGWAFETGLPLNGILWTCVAFMAGLAWPMAIMLRRSDRRRAD